MKFYEANCMGYALRVNDWGLIDDYKDGPEELLALCDFLVPVKRKDMILGKVYIAYRYGRYDFHFMRRDEKGHWRHKPGRTYVRDIAVKDVFAKSWRDGYYNSKIFLFEDTRFS